MENIVPDLIDDYESDMDVDEPSFFADTPVSLPILNDSDSSSAPNGAPKSKRKKLRQTFAAEKAQKLNYSAISEYLESIHKAAFRCCAFLCYSWLTTALVLFCREKYLLIENSKDRTEWLLQRLEEMEDTTKQRLLYAYYIENMEGEKRRCCGAAWDFAHGVNKRTRERASKRRRTRKGPNSPNNKTTPRNKGLTDRELYCVCWLKQYAAICGDHLPFSEHVQQTEIRLPFARKNLVYDVYKNSLKDDPTQFAKPCTLQQFLGTWKNRKDVKHIKCAKYKPGFSKCDKCDHFSENLKKHLDPLVKDQIRLELNMHIQEKRLEREQYYTAQAKAVERPDK
jgi:hypothetical protein